MTYEQQKFISHSVTGQGRYGTQVQLLATRQANSRDRCWWKRKSCFIQQPSSVGRWWTSVLRPSPSCRLGDRGFIGSVRVREGAAGSLVSLSYSRIGRHQCEVSSITSHLVSTSLGSKCWRLAVFTWWGLLPVRTAWGGRVSGLYP